MHLTARRVDHCRSLSLSIVRLSTKRMAIRRPATSPAMPLLKCSGVQRFSCTHHACRLVSGKSGNAKAYGFIRHALWRANQQ